MVKLLCSVFLAMCLCVHAVSAEEKEPSRSLEYCVIGAGPSGLQMGYFLKRAGRDYLLFERSNVSGAFYTKYPRHDKLISINKRHTGQKNKEFNLRHDWNSLISDDESLKLGRYTKELFPHRDIYVKYLNDYQKKLGIDVQHNTEVSNIRKIDEQEPESHFLMDDQHGNTYDCRVVIVATGISEPNTPKYFKGMEYTENYDTASLNPDDYEGKTVLIVGRGNSAFELADGIYGATNLIHMVARSRVKLSWETHYVGDVRAVNNALLDTYQLKSLDGILEAATDDLELVKDENGALIVKAEEKDSRTGMYLTDNFALRVPYDKVILCTGFRFNTSIFNNSTKPEMANGRKKKYPRVNHLYEALNIHNLFFAGTNTHSIDFRKSAGGFIHGFRYTARVTHNHLEWRIHGIPWPATRLPITELMNTILKRVNEASGIYQMFQVLGDAIIIDEDGQHFEYLEEVPIHRIYEENFYMSLGRKASRLMMLVLEYGPDFSGAGNDIFSSDRATGEPSEGHQSNFLHPVIYYYESLPKIEDLSWKPKDFTLPIPTKIHHMVEDFITTWDGADSHIMPLRRFLEHCLGHDMRHFFADQCFQMALTNKNLPLSCQEHFMNGGGLTGTPELLKMAKINSFV